MNMQNAKLLVCGLLLIALQPLQAQFAYFNTVHGTVLDEKTGKPLSGVNVFLSKTTLGTVTDADGVYRIEHAPPGVYDLVFQHVGYTMKIQQVQFAYVSTIQIDTKLMPRILEGREVRITGRYTKERIRRLQEFTRMFLGETRNAKACRILNPEALDFKIDSTDGRWTARSEEAVVVENLALGYTVRNYIIRFKWSKSLSQIQQNIFTVFKPIPAADANTSETWARNREAAFLGSQKHFLSAVAQHRIDEEGFKLYQSNIQPLEDRDSAFREEGSGFYIPSKIFYGRNRSGLSMDTVSYPQNKIGLAAGLVKLQFKDWLKIKYGVTFSYLNLEGHSLIVDSLGNNWNPTSYQITGRWAYSGAADKLPLDYSPQPATSRRTDVR